MLTRLETTDPVPVLYCETAYVRYDLWRKGILVAAYYPAKRGAANAFGPDAAAHFYTGPSMPVMMALVRRGFTPVSMWVDDWLMSQ